MKNYKDFFNAAAKTPQTFNSFYIDNEHVGEYTSGQLPIRDAQGRSGPAHQGHRQVRVDGLPLEDKATRRASTRRTGRSSTGTRPSPGASAPPTTNFGRNGSVMRDDLLDQNLKRLKGTDGKWSPATSPRR